MNLLFTLKLNSWISVGNGEANPVELCSDETSNVAPGDRVLECDQGESNYVKPGK